ncbi:hypothetical protein GY45DRAFT_1376076, partial [Cubamyces sp. BRFM 1775]
PGPVELNWGKYNNRAVDPSHVKSLLIDFQGSEGIDAFRNPLPCVVDEAWIDSESLSKTLENPSRVKTITWTSAARLSRVEVLGGRHRTQALAQYADILKKQLVTERNNLSKAETKAKGAASDKAKNLMAVVSTLEDQVRTAGFMAAAFYKRAGFKDVHGEYLSMNETKPALGMTSAERLFSWASKAARKAEETGTTEGPRSPHWSEKVVQPLWNHVERKNNHRLIRILSSPFLYPLVQALIPFPSMRDGKTVTIKQFNDLLTPANAGFGQFWAQVLITKASQMRFIASSVEGWPALNDGDVDDPDISYKIDTMKRYLGWLQHRRHECLVRHQKIATNVDNPGRRVPSNRLKGVLADYSELIDESLASHEVEAIWPSSLFDEVDSIYKDVISERWCLLLAHQCAEPGPRPEETAEGPCEDDPDEDPEEQRIRSTREAKRKERLKKQQEQERFANPRTWEDAVEAYYARVDVAVKKEWTRARQRATGSAHNGLATALKQVEIRWEWMKTVWMNDPYGVPLPLPTASFIADLFDQLSEVRQAIKFICRTVQPMADVVSAGKGSAFYDHSTALWDYVEDNPLVDYPENIQADLPTWLLSLLPEIKVLEALLKRSSIMSNDTIWSSPLSAWQKMHPSTLGAGEFLKTFNPVFEGWRGDFVPHIDRIIQYLFSHHELVNKSNRGKKKASAASVSRVEKYLPFSPQALQDSDFLYIITRAKVDFGISTLSAKRSFSSMGVWAFVTYIAYLRVHGNIFTTPTGIVLRDELHRLFGFFAVSPFPRNLVPEHLYNNHPPVHGWINWDHVPLILAAGLPRFEWIGESLFEDIEGHDDLLSTTLRRNDWHKSLRKLVDTVLAMPAAQYDPLNTEDTSGESTRLSGWVQEPLDCLIQSIALNMQRLEIQAVVGYPTEDRPIVFDRNNLAFAFPTVQDAAVGAIHDVHTSLNDWEDDDPIRFGKYMRAVYNDSGVAGLEDPLSQAPPHLIKDGWLDLPPLSPEEIARFKREGQNTEVPTRELGEKPEQSQKSRSNSPATRPVAEQPQSSPQVPMDTDPNESPDLVPTQLIHQDDTPLASRGEAQSSTSAQCSISSDTSSVIAVAGTQISTSQSEKDALSPFVVTPLAAPSLTRLPSASPTSDVEDTIASNPITRPNTPPSPSSSESDIPPKKKRRTVGGSTATVAIATRHSARSKNDTKLASATGQAAPAASHRPSVSAAEQSNRIPPAKHGVKTSSGKGKAGPSAQPRDEVSEGLAPPPKKARHGQPRMENYA